jgi:uncharacterized lipoprotein YddW (UPF0748 family)
MLGICVGLCGCSTGDDSAAVPRLYGTWVQGRSVSTPEKADAMLDRVETGRLNAVFVNVFFYGHAHYESELLEKEPSLAPEYDPLAYVIEQAHQRDIAVHVWLVAGPVGDGEGPGPILTKHPDWAMIGPDGQQSHWLNYNRPDVRQFIGDLVLEIVRNYDVDGVHFDYTRYPGSQWSFDPYSAKLFAQEYDADLELLRCAELPAYATFRGNPLVGVGTAQVLAKFGNGRPALVLNSYGDGEAILFNWDANDRQIAVSSEILRRSIDYLLQEHNDIYILRSEANAERYGFKCFDEVISWLEDLGWSPVWITDAELGDLGTDEVLVMPNVYLIGTQVAADLADFVYHGGGVIFIDGPTPSIDNRNLQAVTGMRARGIYFRESDLLVATDEHVLIPASNRDLDRRDYQALDAQWKMLRKRGINTLLEEVYRRAKQQAPDVLITITVAANQETLAERQMLDWQAWLEGGYVDLIIPRAYVNQDEPLAPIIGDWNPVMRDSAQVALGLQAYSGSYGKGPLKTPAGILTEVDLALNRGAVGVVLFDAEHLSDDVLRALATGPFSSLTVGSD